MLRKRYEAKLDIAEAFIALAETIPVDKITVGMIAERTGKHRKTFYYHFTGKNELIVWLFRYDLACGLLAAFPADKLVYECAQDEGMYPTLPFYLRNTAADGRLYHAEFFDVLSSSLNKRRAFYRRIFSRVGFGTLEDYLYRLYVPQIRGDILYLIDRWLARGRGIDAATLRARLTGGPGVDFLAEFYTGAFILRIIKRLQDEQIQRTAAQIQPFENVIHDSLSLMIGAYIDRAGDEGEGSEEEGGKAVPPTSARGRATSV